MCSPTLYLFLFNVVSVENRRCPKGKSGSDFPRKNGSDVLGKNGLEHCPNWGR